MKAIGAVGAAVLAFCAFAGETPPKERTSPPHVIVAPVRPVQLTSGTPASAEISIVVAEGFHVQANPAADEFLIPLTLELEDAPGIHWGAPVYPPPRAFRIEGWDLELKTYEGTVRISVPVLASDTAPRGTVRAEGRLRYQACDSRRCFAPTSIPFAIGIVTGY